MGTYKVIQDIEAEDKLLGPLSLRQFIYAVIVVICIFVSYKLAEVHPLLILPLVPPILFFGFLAAPVSKVQPSEVWLLAKIRFFLKPKRRIWDQSGIKELVTITAPKKIEKVLTDNLSQTEVRSRLEALATTIDSRGWAVKNVNVNMFAQPSYVLGQVDSDRLIDPSTMGQEVPSYDVHPTDDMLDVTNNSRAQALDMMIASSTQFRKQQVIEQMKDPQAQKSDQPKDYWFLHQNPAPTQPGMAAFDSRVVLPGQEAPTQPTEQAIPGIDEQALLEKIHAEQARKAPGDSHMKKIKPLSEQTAEQKKEPKSKKAKPAEKQPQIDPTIARLAGSNDYNISTIARQAEQARKQPPNDEVVISLR